MLVSIKFQVKLHFTENAMRLIAKKAMAKNTCARGLRAILENIAPMIRCLLLLVELFLIGLGREDSHLVIPSFLFFAPFLFCNFSIVWFSFMFLPIFLFLYFLGLLYVLHA